MKKQIIKLTENDLHRLIKRCIKESFYDSNDTELSEYEKYEQGYPNDDFTCDTSDLMNFVLHSGDFLYYSNGKFRAANSQEIINEIAEEIEKYGAEISHDIDFELDWSWDKLFGYDETHVAVFKVYGEGLYSPYYIIYVEPC